MEQRDDKAQHTPFDACRFTVAVFLCCWFVFFIKIISLSSPTIEKKFKKLQKISIYSS